MHRYDDIITLQHHVSNKRKAMSLLERSAQFAPFAALTGHDAAVKETARLTNIKHELSEEQIDTINHKISILQSLIPNSPIVEITYFKKDITKDGGEYVTVFDGIIKILENEQKIIMSEGLEINFNDINDIYCDIFKFDIEPK